MFLLILDNGIVVWQYHEWLYNDTQTSNVPSVFWTHNPNTWCPGHGSHQTADTVTYLATRTRNLSQKSPSHTHLTPNLTPQWHSCISTAVVSSTLDLSPIMPKRSGSKITFSIHFAKSISSNNKVYTTSTIFSVWLREIGRCGIID